MTIRLSDYTMSVGQGFSMDEVIKENPDLNGSVLKNISKKISGNGRLELPQNLLTLTVIQTQPYSALAVETYMNLLSEVKNEKFDYQLDQKTCKLQEFTLKS